MYVINMCKLPVLHCYLCNIIMYKYLLKIDYVSINNCFIVVSYIYYNFYNEIDLKIKVDNRKVKLNHLLHIVKRV